MWIYCTELILYYFDDLIGKINMPPSSENKIIENIKFYLKNPYEELDMEQYIILIEETLCNGKYKIMEYLLGLEGYSTLLPQEYIVNNIIGGLIERHEDDLAINIMEKFPKCERYEIYKYGILNNSHKILSYLKNNPPRFNIDIYSRDFEIIVISDKLDIFKTLTKNNTPNYEEYTIFERIIYSISYSNNPDIYSYLNLMKQNKGRILKYALDNYNIDSDDLYKALTDLLTHKKNNRESRLILDSPKFSIPSPSYKDFKIALDNDSPLI